MAAQERAFQGIIEGNHVQGHTMVETDRGAGVIYIAMMVVNAPDEIPMADTPVFHKAMLASFGTVEEVQAKCVMIMMATGCSINLWTGERHSWETVEQCFKRAFPGVI